MRSWEIREYELLFRDRPPTQPTAPTTEECDALGARLGRSRGAVKAQWDDARSVVLCHKSAASAALRDYVRSRGWV